MSNDTNINERYETSQVGTIPVTEGLSLVFETSHDTEKDTNALVIRKTVKTSKYEGPARGKPVLVPMDRVQVKGSKVIIDVG